MSPKHLPLMILPLMMDLPLILPLMMDLPLILPLMILPLMMDPLRDEHF